MEKQREFKNKLKLTFPILVLVFLFSILIFNLIHVKYLEEESLSVLKKKIVLATKLSKVLHEVQKERGMSVGYLSNSDQSFQNVLNTQKKYTNNSILELEKYCNDLDVLSIDSLKNTLNLLSKIQQIRSSVSKITISPASASFYYTKIDDKILDTILAITKIAQSSPISNDANSYLNLLYYEENLGLERAVGTNILSDKKINQETINLFNAYIVKQKVYQDLYLKYASKHSKTLYKSRLKNESLKTIVEIRTTILSAQESSINKIQAYKWFKHMTILIDILKEIDNHLSRDILQKIENNYTNSKKSLVSYAFLGFIMSSVFILMIIMILQLQKNEKKLKNLLNTYVISSTTDLKGIITGVSQAFCKISGYEEDELIGKPHNMVRHPDIPKELFKSMWKTIESGNIWQGEIKNLAKDRGYYWVTAVISPLYDNGKKIGYSSVRQDITDGKRIEELNKSLEEKISIEVAKSRQKDQQMIQQSRLAQMGEMISMIAHQWRQPLTAISATSATIHYKAKKDLIDKEFLLERTNRISEYSKHLSSTIDDFREFFKPDKEQKETTFEELLRSVFGIVEASLVQQNITLHQSLRYTDSFQSYPNELKQVILNLIKNAEDILIEKDISDPYIKLETYKDKSTIILEISDNGGGVDSSIMDKIFDPYFSTKLKKDGTGLGLYMSKTIIEDHCQGKLYVHNSADGAVFSIVLYL